MTKTKFNVWDVDQKKMFNNALELTKEGYTKTFRFDNSSSENLIWLLSFGQNDKKGKEIFEGDIIELIDDVGNTIRIICEYGKVKRNILGSVLNLCEITGFSFRKNDFSTFPIVRNYKGVNDVELFEVIGNIYENPELIKT